MGGRRREGGAGRKSGLVMIGDALLAKTVGNDMIESGEQEVEAARQCTTGAAIETCIDGECNKGPSTYTHRYMNHIYGHG